MITSVVFFAALLLSLPIFLTLLLGTFVFLQQTDLAVLMSSLPIQLFGSLNQNGLLAIPLFMLVGEVMNKGGLTPRLMNAADIFVGGFKGGMAYVNLLTNAMAASILGSAAAQISVMTRLMVPAMLSRGYNKEFSTAVTISGGLMGAITPPSMLMIIYGIIANQSVAALFIAGILPGLLILLGFALVVFLFGFFSTLPAGNKLRQRSVRKDLISGLLPGSIPVAVIACIISGVMSPTEAGAVAALLSFILGFVVYREIKLTDLPAIFSSVALSTATITGLIASATVFGWALSFEGVPDALVGYVSQLTSSPVVFLLLIFALVVLLGTFLESIAVMIVLAPIILPSVEAFNIDLIHFGVIMCLATLLGLVTPPIGPGLYVAMDATGLNMMQLFRALLPFLAIMLVCMLLVILLPQISLWLPGLML